MGGMAMVVSVESMREHVKQRTREEKQVREHTQGVAPLLIEEGKRGDEAKERASIVGP